MASLLPIKYSRNEGWEKHLLFAYNLRVSSRENHLFMTHSARIISLDTLIAPTGRLDRERAPSWDIVGIRI